ncbi:MAG: hypothetical protein QM811_00935 [Pirellulales bacterium]
MLFRDHDEQVIACGRFSAPLLEPQEGEAFEDIWNLQSYLVGFPATATADGLYRGTVDEGRLWIHLRPNDDGPSVILAGVDAPDRISGVWMLEDRRGDLEKRGTFTILKSNLLTPRESP